MYGIPCLLTSTKQPVRRDCKWVSDVAELVNEFVIGVHDVYFKRPPYCKLMLMFEGSRWSLLEPVLSRALSNPSAITGTAEWTQLGRCCGQVQLLTSCFFVCECVCFFKMFCNTFLHIDVHVWLWDTLQYMQEHYIRITCILKPGVLSFLLLMFLINTAWSPFKGFCIEVWVSDKIMDD